MSLNDNIMPLQTLYADEDHVVWSKAPDQPLEGLIKSRYI